jgi:hypothetical protein
MWLYPLPAIVALGLWGFVLASPSKGFQVAGLVVIVAGVSAFLVRSRLAREWPFAGAAGQESAAP